MTTTEDRFMSKVSLRDDGCWEWTGAIQSNGYGRFGLTSRTVVGAHRAAYLLFVGPIDKGLVLDHVCHNTADGCPGGASCLHRRCVNPDHLEPVTKGENARRSPLRGSPWRSKLTHCKHGHAFAEHSVTRNGHRECRTCKITRSRVLRLTKEKH